jgi:hypothetical protein
MKANDTIDKYKTRFIKTFRQYEGVDYINIYSPVSKITFIRTMIVIAAINKLGIHHMNVKITFLNSDLEKEVYIEQPEGFVVNEQEKKISKLIKLVYGLKQEPK